MFVSWNTQVYGPEDGTGAGDPGASAPADTGTPADTSAIEQDFDMEMLDSVIESAPIEKVEEVPPTNQSAQPTEGQPGVQPGQPVAGNQQTAATPAAAGTPPVAVQQPQVDPNAQQPTAGQPGAQGAPEVDPFSVISQAIEQGRAQVVDAIADQVYKMTPEMAEALATEPEKVVPKLLANVHVNAVQGVMRHVAQQMPTMIAGLMQAQQENTRREDAFFKAWPQLDRSQHMQDIVRVGQVFKQLNPTATMEDFIRHVGAQVVIAKGLHAQRQQQQTMQQPVQHQAPPPFVPAGAGHMSPMAQPQQQMNIWDEFVEVMRE